MPFFILLENEKLKESISCNTQESMIRRYAIFSSSTITFMSNWRNPVMKKHHPKTSIKTGKVNLTRTSYATKLLLLKHHKMACLRCFKGKWLLLWQIFDRTHTEEKPIHVQAMQQKLVCLKHHKNGMF